MMIRLDLVLFVKFIYIKYGSFLLHSTMTCLFFVCQVININSTGTIIEDCINFLQALALGLHKPFPYNKQSY